MLLLGSSDLYNFWIKFKEIIGFLAEELKLNPSIKGFTGLEAWRSRDRVDSIAIYMGTKSWLNLNESN